MTTDQQAIRDGIVGIITDGVGNLRMSWDDIADRIIAYLDTQMSDLQTRINRLGKLFEKEANEGMTIADWPLFINGIIHDLSLVEAARPTADDGSEPKLASCIGVSGDEYWHYGKNHRLFMRDAKPEELESAARHMRWRERQKAKERGVECTDEMLKAFMAALRQDYPKMPVEDNFRDAIAAALKAASKTT